MSNPDDDRANYFRQAKIDKQRKSAESKLAAKELAEGLTESEKLVRQLSINHNEIWIRIKININIKSKDWEYSLCGSSCLPTNRYKCIACCICAPFAIFLLSAIRCYKLADKIDSDNHNLSIKNFSRMYPIMGRPPAAGVNRQILREQIRDKYNINIGNYNNNCGDCCISYFCPLCSAYQEELELNYFIEKYQILPKDYKDLVDIDNPAPTNQIMINTDIDNKEISSEENIKKSKKDNKTKSNHHHHSNKKKNKKNQIIPEPQD